jgi:hypothetical protein
MKITSTKIKSWDSKQRLKEIEKRLEFIDSETITEWLIDDRLDNSIREALQIVRYWKRHLNAPVEPKKEPKEKTKEKPCNVWK